MPAIFSATSFLSAALLFSIQPIIAKMLLPLLGGTPAVWTTCMVFFQGALLAGYLYAHLLSSRLTPRAQSAVHLGLLLLAGLALPFGVTDDSVRSLVTDANPAGWLLQGLLTTVGLPFFVISASAPLLQKWFSKTGHPSAHDPYSLYAASNLGSLIALLSYPVLVEPNLRLATQSQFWTAGYAALGVLFLLCLAAQSRSLAKAEAHDLLHLLARDEWGEDRGEGKSNREGPPLPPSPGRGKAIQHITCGQRFFWIALAFVPSSLMLGVTTYLTTDIASIPLLWILPLSLYLLTFVLAFAQRAIIPRGFLHRVMPLAAVGLIYLVLSEATEPVALLIGIHLLFFFLAALVCHSRLASERPAATYLTEYYFWLSLGGVLGGLFNALVAPNLFRQVIEYPIAMVLACLLRPDQGRTRATQKGPRNALLQKVWSLMTNLWHRCLFSATVRAVSPHPGPLPWGEGELSTNRETSERSELAETRPFDLPLPVGEGRGEGRGNVRPARLLITGAGVGRWFDVTLPAGLGLLTILLVLWIPHFEDVPVQVGPVLIFGLPLVLAATLADRALRFGLGLAAILLASTIYVGGHGRALHVERNFFGVLRVTRDPDGAFRRLVHGNTVHGRQFIDPARRSEPLSYYHRSGPLGQIFKIFEDKTANTNVAVVGLGAGSMAAYARRHQRWSYFEINPAVISLAANTNYFTFLAESHPAEARMIVGDARLRLREAPENHFDLILLDAFSSDAIPAHLITREALELYVSKLAEGGFLVFHISNRCLDLEPILGDLAWSQRLVCFAHDEADPSEWELAGGKDQSHWAVIARRVEDLGRLTKDGRWQPVTPRRDPQVWTDDFSNIWSVFKWR